MAEFVTNTDEAFGPIDPNAGKKEFPVGEVTPITSEQIAATRERYRNYHRNTSKVSITEGSSALTLSEIHNPAWS